MKKMSISKLILIYFFFLCLTTGMQGQSPADLQQINAGAKVIYVKQDHCESVCFEQSLQTSL